MFDEAREVAKQLIEETAGIDNPQVLKAAKGMIDTSVRDYTEAGVIDQIPEVVELQSIIDKRIAELEKNA